MSCTGEEIQLVLWSQKGLLERAIASDPLSISQVKRGGEAFLEESSRGKEQDPCCGWNWGKTDRWALEMRPER